MKPGSTFLPFLFSIATIVSPASAQEQYQQQQKQEQSPLVAIPESMPFTYDRDSPTEQPAVRLSDVLPSRRALSTFSALARRCEAADAVLSSSARKTTVLAPSNAAVEGLPRKPWEEDPRKLEAEGLAGDGGAGAYEGEEGRQRADRNLRRFVEAHLVGQAPWAEGEKVKTLDGEGRGEGGGGGREVWWESRPDGGRVVMPDGVEVESVAGRVGNGELVSLLALFAATSLLLLPLCFYFSLHSLLLLPLPLSLLLVLYFPTSRAVVLVLVVMLVAVSWGSFTSFFFFSF